MRTRLLSLGVTVSLVALSGCTDADRSSTIEKPADGKADELDRLCELLNEPTTCDPCEVADWYGDGQCDAFCPLFDAADCDPPDPGLAAGPFLAASSYTTSAFQIFENSELKYRFVATDLSQSSADAWAQTRAAMAGDGFAVHVSFPTTSRITGDVETIVLRRNTDTVLSNSCSPWYTPLEWGGSNKILYVVRWQGGDATTAVCTVGGSVRVRWIEGVQDKVELTFNVEFSDGNTWVDRVLTFDID